MKGILLLFILVLSTATRAAEPSAALYLERMETMVKTGVITNEAAQKLQVYQSKRQHDARRAAQRDLASVHPDLKPLKPLQLKRLKVEPMVLFLD